MKKPSTEELLKEAINNNLCRTKVNEVKNLHAYDLYELELTNNNITQSELQRICDVVGDDDLQIEAKGGWLYVVATIDDDMIEEIREQYE